MRRSPAPLWFHVLIALLVAGAWRALAPAAADAPAVQLAFWGWFVVIAQAVWGGLQFAGTASLYVLHIVVNSLASIVRVVANGVKAFGKVLQGGLLEAWKFFRSTYETILKPAWLKVWRIVDWARDTLEDFFRPIFKFLRHLRDELLSFYSKWIRPILDTIGIARKVLSVFKALGLDWAKKLDAKLASLEDAIDRPFRALLGKLNEVINFVNRIATADGLFQRLALVRSIERDIRYVSRAFINWRSAPLTEADYAAIRHQTRERTIDDVRRDTAEVLETGEGRYGAVVAELIAQWRLYLSGH